MTLRVLRYETILAAGCLLLVVSSAMAKGTAAEQFIVAGREAFMNALKLDRPELAEVKANLEKGDVKAAESAYIKYFRSKPWPKSPALIDWDTVQRDAGYDPSGVEAFMAGHIATGYDAPATGIDWRDAPLVTLTRLNILTPAAYAYLHTGQVKFARFIVDHIYDYMRAYPIEEWIGEDDQGFRGDLKVCRPWEWCMVTRRLQQESRVLGLARKCQQVTDDELLTILHRMYQEARYLRVWMPKWIDMRHNGGLAMILCMTPTFLALEDFEDSDEWMDFCLKGLRQYIKEAFYPDGTCIELSTPYCGGIINQVMETAYALYGTGEQLEPSRQYLNAMVDWAIGVSKPCGNCPSFGDGCGHPLSYMLHEQVVSKLDVPWALTLLGKQDEPLPPYTVWPRPGQEQWGGYYAMRSNWSKEALYMCIDGGVWGISHQHGDKLSFELAAYGADLIVDPTGTCYHSPRPDAYLSRQNAGFLHNTITVDGVDEFRYVLADGRATHLRPKEITEPLDNTWEHGEHYSLFTADYSFQPLKAVTWERRVLFADKRYWLLQDVLTGDQAEAEIEQNFQFDIDIEIEFDGTTTIATAPNGARLAIVPLTGDLNPMLTIGDKTPHVTYWPDGIPTDDWYPDESLQAVSHGRGWMGNGGYKLIPAPAVTYVGKVKLPGILTLALIPLQPGQSLDEMPRIASEAANGETTWLLPTGEGRVTLVSSVDECRVNE
jgi:hypothetical protein